MMPQTGFLLHGRYQIVQELGSGGFATVYLAQDGRLNGRYVAVKEFNVAKLAPADRGWARQSFQHEASVLSGLNHESIAAISDFFSMGGLDYLVMEYVPGETLTQAWQRAGKRIHPDRMLIWAWELCRVLDYLHRQNPPIIFRDLKPDNIMVMPDGRLKIIDFGIARHFKPGQTRDTHALGTPGYASPEQYRPVQTDARSDVYSLAVVLHQLLTGYDPSLQPFAPLPDVLALSPHVPAHIARAIHQALNADPARRFPLVRDFAAALGSSVAPPVGGALPTRNATRSWIWIMGSVVVLGLFGFFAGLGALFLRQTPATATPTAVVSTEVVTVMVTAVATSDPPMPTATLAVHAGEAVTVTPILAPTVTAVTILPTLPATVETPTASPTAAPAVLLANDRPIVFDSTQDVDYAEIYIMNSDGSYEQRLTFNTVHDDEADLSPDGQWIAFDQGANNTESIWLMRSDGSEARSVVNGRSPDWSPDGRYLAFETWGDSSHIWIYDVSRGASWQLTSGSRPYRAPDWSPEGLEIVAMSRFGSDWQIVVVDVATGAERPITSGSGDKRFPAWSPDGSLIAYNTLTGDWPDDIWLIEPSGAGARAITGSGNNGRPTWSPDGQFLVFNSYINRQWVLYQVDRDGRQGKQLTTSGHDQRASWSN